MEGPTNTDKPKQYNMGWTWVIFSTQDVGVQVNAMKMHPQQKQPSLKLKTRPKQLLG